NSAAEEEEARRWAGADLFRLRDRGQQGPHFTAAERAHRRDSGHTSTPFDLECDARNRSRRVSAAACYRKRIRRRPGVRLRSATTLPPGKTYRLAVVLHLSGESVELQIEALFRECAFHPADRISIGEVI